MKHNIIIIAGTRPECIKMAPVYFALQKSDLLNPIFLSTAQHRQMLDQALAVFGIRPDFDLNLMQPGQTLGDLTARVLTAVGGFLAEHKPAAILVQGDTTTVLASALAAFYARVPVGHVEAGLRTGDMASPFPEEMNRRLTSPLARWHFCPTAQSRENLLREGVSGDACFVTGNTVIDSLLHVRERLAESGVAVADVAARCQIPQDFSETFFNAQTASSISPARWLLVTGHRRESFGDGFETLCRAILRLTEKYPQLGVLYPVHLNPQVQEPVKRILGGHPRIALIPPVGYEDFIWLMDRCYFVLSDSGGVQEEAPSLGKPVLVMRETTERPEGVAAGTCRLVGTDPQKILHEASLLLDDSAEYTRRSTLRNPYGQGTAATQIRTVLEAAFSSPADTADCQRGIKESPQQSLQSSQKQFRVFSILAFLLAACLLSACPNKAEEHARIPKNDKDSLVHNADGKLPGQQVLAIIAKTDKDWRVRQRAVGELTDQQLLADIAKNDVDWHVRHRAVGKLTDPQVLTDIAKNDLDKRVRMLAVKKITDQHVLADIAKNDKDKLVRKTATQCLSDPQLLADVAKEGNGAHLMDMVKKKLTDPKLLADVAKNAESPFVRLEAVQKLTDQKLLTDIAMNDKEESFVRTDAVKKLTDQQLLTDIAMNVKNHDVRAMALWSITDQQLLADFLKNDKESKVRLFAMANLTDQQALAAAAKNDKDIVVRVMAVGKLTEEHKQLLAEIAKNDKETLVRVVAVGKLTEEHKQLLTEIAENDEEEVVRRQAARVLAGLPTPKL
jgi:UDP-N-acetylglucosamine 2-epimerase